MAITRRVHLFPCLFRQTHGRWRRKAVEAAPVDVTSSRRPPACFQLFFSTPSIHLTPADHACYSRFFVLQSILELCAPCLRSCNHLCRVNSTGILNLARTPSHHIFPNPSILDRSYQYASNILYAPGARADCLADREPATSDLFHKVPLLWTW